MCDHTPAVVWIGSICAIQMVSKPTHELIWCRRFRENRWRWPEIWLIMSFSGCVPWHVYAISIVQKRYIGCVHVAQMLCFCVAAVLRMPHCWAMLRRASISFYLGGTFWRRRPELNASCLPWVGQGFSCVAHHVCLRNLISPQDPQGNRPAVGISILSSSSPVRNCSDAWPTHLASRWCVLTCLCDFSCTSMFHRLFWRGPTTVSFCFADALLMPHYVELCCDTPRPRHHCRLVECFLSSVLHAFHELAKVASAFTSPRDDLELLRDLAFSVLAGGQILPLCLPSPLPTAS